MNRINYLFILLLLILTSCSYKDIEKMREEGRTKQKQNNIERVEYCKEFCAPFKVEHFINNGQCICGVKK